MEEKLGLASPWAIHASMLEALFEGDDSVIVDFADGEDGPKTTIYVDGQGKAEAIDRIIPDEVTFGNVTMKVSVVPSNKERSASDTFLCAFAGNPAFSGIGTEELPTGGTVTYAMFAPEVAQFYADDLSDIHRVKTMTYEQLAKEVLAPGEARICSDLLPDMESDEVLF